MITGLSVGFNVTKVEVEKRGGEGAKGYEVDRIVEGKLSEVSTVSFPAIPGARIKNSGDATESDGLATFAIIDGKGSEGCDVRLHEGDFVRLATFASIPTAPIERVRPNPKAVLSEDEKHPGARDALMCILAR